MYMGVDGYFGQNTRLQGLYDGVICIVDTLYKYVGFGKI